VEEGPLGHVVDFPELFSGGDEIKNSFFHFHRIVQIPVSVPYPTSSSFVCCFFSPFPILFALLESAFFSKLFSFQHRPKKFVSVPRAPLLALVLHSALLRRFSYL